MAATITDFTKEALEAPIALIRETETDVTDIIKKGEDIVDTTIGRGTMLIDRTRADTLYTFRDSKSEFLHTADSAIDNLAKVVDRTQTNFFDTIQFGTIVGVFGVGLFFWLFVDKIFDRPVKVGSFTAF